MYGQASTSRPPALPGPSEFDILKTSHKFLRDDGEDPNESSGTANANGKTSWEDRLAQKYYASLYREFAVCDLKHYKSGNFALRWRTESEVVSGAGEETCGNTRCPLHDANNPNPNPSPSESKPISAGLKTVELPFAYEEHGERKSALVKVVLCDACLRRLMWKREKEKKEQAKRLIESAEGEKDMKEKEEGRSGSLGRDGNEKKGNDKPKAAEEEHDRRERSARKERDEEHRPERRKRKSRSRSQSPSSHRRKREHRDKHRQHNRSPF